MGNRQQPQVEGGRNCWGAAAYLTWTGALADMGDQYHGVQRWISGR
jgi:hypothetical protein